MLRLVREGELHVHCTNHKAFVGCYFKLIICPSPSSFLSLPPPFSLFLPLSLSSSPLFLSLPLPLFLPYLSPSLPQVIAFIDCLLSSESTNINRVLVLCPVNTLLNWNDEWNKWVSISRRDYRVRALILCYILV